MKTIEQAIQAATDCLAGMGLENPRLESEFLIAAYLKKPRAHLLLHRAEAISEKDVEPLQGWLREREQRKPLAYITGEQPFRDLRLKVNPSVLIPRPETELLVEQAIRSIEKMGKDCAVVDVGTGSGAIALSLASHSQVQEVIGIDLSSEAIEVARENERSLSLSRQVTWRVGDLLSPLRDRVSGIDVIVANLPYVTTDEMRSLEPELHWEPRLALEAGEDGLRYIRPCVEQSSPLLIPGGTLLLEIGYRQAEAVTEMLESCDKWRDIQVYRDFSGHPRIVQAWRAHG